MMSGQGWEERYRTRDEGHSNAGMARVSVSVTKCDHAVYKSSHGMLLHRCTYMIVYGRVCESNDIEIL